MIDREHFQLQFRSVAEKRRLSFSPQAEDLIYQTLAALEEDPNPNWPRSETKELSNIYVENIDLLVAAFSEEWPPESWYDRGYMPAPWIRRPPWKRRSQRRGEVHYFEVLHFISDNLSWLNPFPKDRPGDG